MRGHLFKTRNQAKLEVALILALVISAEIQASPPVAEANLRASVGRKSSGGDP